MDKSSELLTQPPKGQKKGITRRQFLKAAAATTAATFLGKGLYDLIFNPIQSAENLVGLNPQLLLDYGKNQAQAARSNMLQLAPHYPVKSIESNPTHLSLQTLARDSVAEAISFANGSLSLTWDLSQKLSDEKIQEFLPTLPDLMGISDKTGGSVTFNATGINWPAEVKDKIDWSTNTVWSYKDIPTTVPTFLAGMVTDQMRTKVISARNSWDTELRQIDRVRRDGSITIEQFNQKAKELDSKLFEAVAIITQPIMQHFVQVRNLVEERRKKTGRPVSPSYVAGYYIWRNQGDILKGLIDACIFFKTTARNDFRTGISIGDRPEAKKNIDWLRENIRDTAYFANWKQMPIVTGSNLVDLPKNDPLFAELTSAQNLPLEQKSNFSVENQIGSIYHALNDLWLCAFLPWQMVSLGSILRLQGAHGTLKVAREAASASELPEALKYLDKFKA